jgi:hypothetical protein
MASGKPGAVHFGNLRLAQEAAQAYVRVGSRTNSHEIYTETVIEGLKKQAFFNHLQPTPDRSALCDADQGDDTDLETRECYKLSLQSPFADGEKRTAAEIVRAFSSANPCLKCIHGVFFKHNQRIVKAKLERLDKSRRLAATPEAEKSAHELFLEYEANLGAAEKAALGGA